MEIIFFWMICYEILGAFIVEVFVFCRFLNYSFSSHLWIFDKKFTRKK